MPTSFVHIYLFTISILNLVYGTNDDRPRIEVTNGDLVIKPALNRNIVLRPNGALSTVFIGSIDVMKQSVSQKTSYEPTSEKDIAPTQINDDIRRIQQLVEQYKGTIPSIIANISTWSPQVRRIQDDYRFFSAIIGRDHCQNQPCLNGGTCLSLILKRQCLCAAGWEGADCNLDVNECHNFNGTELGCQNGATCINKAGSYECLCLTGWYGMHCTRKSQDCFGGDFDMCGHGSCVPVTTGTGINCICDQGWTHNETSATCLTDINECESYYECSVNPNVECINLPGSFRCGSCPSGYEGDGYACSDIDECMTYNGGCSSSPMVPCYNTVGSRICGQCPSGYIGDGVVCTWHGSCNENQGGCQGRGCGGKISNVFGLVTSPLYPDVYRKVAICEWEIETSVGTHVHLNFIVFDLRKMCKKNFFEIVNRKGEVFSRYCVETPARYRSDDNYVKIVFTTDRNNGGTGWVAEFVGE